MSQNGRQYRSHPVYNAYCAVSKSSFLVSFFSVEKLSVGNDKKKIADLVKVGFVYIKIDSAWSHFLSRLEREYCRITVKVKTS